MKYIRRYRHAYAKYAWREWAYYMLICLAGIGADLIGILSFGYLYSDLRAAVLFPEEGSWIEWLSGEDQ